MSKTKSHKGSATENNPAADNGPDAMALGLLAGLGALATAWAVFLWGELLLVRAGGTPFCAVADNIDCASLWDGAFASAVHTTTKLPIAGWGVVWGVVATFVPLVALVRAAQRKESTSLLTATNLLAIAGGASVLVFIVSSAVAATLCIGCVGTYILVGAYAVVAAIHLRSHGLAELGGGIGIAVGGTVAMFVLLLWPGMSTPLSSAQASKDAIAAAAKARPKPTQQPQQQPQGAETDLGRFLQSLPLQTRQAISDSLHVYKTSPDVPVRPARTTLGKTGGIHITDFTDVRCGHCAQLHATLKEINNVVPAGSFSLEPRHFPLDGACNTEIQRRSPDAVSCIAAKAQICLEGDGAKLWALSGELFEKQQELTPELVYSLTDKYIPRATLEACMSTPETEAKLKDDVSYAVAHALEGTPLVLINGKKATSFGPFLYAMILTGGNPNDPAFQTLPAAKPDAHIH